MKIKLLLATFLISTPLFSQSEKGIQDLDKARVYCDVVANYFYENNLLEAFDILDDILILPENEIRYLEQETLKQFNLIAGRYGSAIGYAKVIDQGIEDHLHSIIYLVKFEYHALRLQFRFYKGKDDMWFLNKFRWDDSIFDILDEK